VCKSGLDSDWLRSDYMDWLCADILLYETYSKIAGHVYLSRRGLPALLVDWAVDAYKMPKWIGTISSLLAKITFVILGWGVTLGIIYGAHEALSPYLAYALFIGLVTWEFVAFRRRGKLYRILDGLKYAYSLLDSSLVPWKTLEQKLRNIIDEGIPIEKELMLIVERNSK
jgi:hypothetical protein